MPRPTATPCCGGATEHAIIATSMDGIITMFTEGAERMLGYSADEVVGRMMPSLFHDPLEIADRAAALGVDASDVFTTRAAAGLTETREWTYLRSDGGRLTVRLTVTPLRNADAELIGYIGIAVDVTAERQAIQALTAAEHRWRTLLEHLPDTSVLVVGADLRYRLTMGSTHHMRGLGEVAGRSVRETTTPENAALLEPVYLEALTGDVAQAELRGRDDRIVAVEAVPLPEQGDLPEALVVARDVTEQRLREQRLTVAEERFRRLFELAPNGVSVIGMDGRLEQVNRALCEMLGTTPESIVGARIDDLDVATDPAASMHAVRPSRRLGGRPGVAAGPGPAQRRAPGRRRGRAGARACAGRHAGARAVPRSRTSPSGVATRSGSRSWPTTTR